jgi:hypothetical protein
MAVGILARAPVRTIRTIGGNVFRIALDELGDAEQFDRILTLNNLTDPWLNGYIELLIPPPLPNPANGGALAVSG